jgi:drug/metabolite transporter (DMT)-like permease
LDARPDLADARQRRKVFCSGIRFPFLFFRVRVMDQKRALRATLIGVVAILLWALLALLTVSARGLPPFELLTLSFAVAALAGLGALALQGRQALGQMRQPWQPWLTAFAGIFGYHALYFYALSAAPAAEASLIAYLWPLLIVLLSALLPGSRLMLRHVAGALLGFAGTGLVILARPEQAGATALGATGATAGYLAAFACALTWSGYSVLNRRFATTPPAMMVGVCGGVALAGALCHLAFEVTVLPDLRQWAALIALGIGPTGLAFLAWDHATKQGQLALLGVLAYLAPLLSTAALVLTGLAPASWFLFAAAALTIAGALIATGRLRGQASSTEKPGPA